MTDVRVASWNLNGATGARAQRLGDLLRRQGAPHVAMLQEVNLGGIERFRSSAGLDWCVCVEDEFADLMAVRGRDSAGGPGKPRGVAIAGAGDRLRSPLAFADVP